MRLSIAVALALVLAGCGSSETKPEPRPTTSDAPATRDVTLSIKNEASEPRLVWVESYHPEKGDKMSGAPDRINEIGTLGPGESVTKTFPVAQRGWYRVVGAKPAGDQGDKRVVFMGSFTRVKDSGDEAPVHVNR